MKGTLLLLLFSFALTIAIAQRPIVHDAEYDIIFAQNGEKWKNDDILIDKKLDDFRKKNGGKAPNIVYILLDDVGFGEMGMPELSVIRGYKTPRIDALAKEGMSLQRFYTEPSCTPTRVAMLTGRYAARTGLNEAKATMAGEGLASEEITIAEMLTASGYVTSHVGKWHMGDISQAYPHNQGFKYAEFPIHQQGQLAIMHEDAEFSDIIRGVDPSSSAQTYTLDNAFVANPSYMVTGVELRDDGKLYEVDLKPGEIWTQKKYREMNERYQASALRELRELSEQDQPFFLNYWPLFPLTFMRDFEEYKTLNGGTVAECLVEVDQWIGEIIDEVKALGIEENTIIMVMGDNGPFMQYAGPTGASDRIYRGGKADHLEGGVRVNSYVSWPGMIEPGTYAEDIIHVSDLFTTFARIAGATQHIPRDRVIDGVDQTGILLLGDSNGRRDYVHIYEGPVFKSLVKNKYKMHLPPPGDNPIRASIFDLYRDPREERPIESIKYGPWAGGQFAQMAKRHMIQKQIYPDRKPTYGIPYQDIENLRPETQKIMDLFLISMGKVPALKNTKQ